jgi:septal ring factor EnvC (AmiA/AmiB activator)
MNGNPIRQYWPQIIALVAISVAWGSNVNRIANAEEDVASQEERVAKIEENLGEVKESVVRIESEQKHQGEDVSDIKDLLDDLLEELRND